MGLSQRDIVERLKGVASTSYILNVIADISDKKKIVVPKWLVEEQDDNDTE